MSAITKTSDKNPVKQTWRRRCPQHPGGAVDTAAFSHPSHARLRRKRAAALLFFWGWISVVKEIKFLHILDCITGGVVAPPCGYAEHTLHQSPPQSRGYRYDGSGGRRTRLAPPVLPIHLSSASPPALSTTVLSSALHNY